MLRSEGRTSDPQRPPPDAAAPRREPLPRLIILPDWLGGETARAVLSSGLLVATRVVAAVATLGFTLLMARTMTPEDVGRVFSVWSVLFVMAVLPTLNIGNAAIREVVKAQAEGRADLASGFIALSRQVLVLLSLPAVALFFAVMAATAPDLLSSHLAAIAIASLVLPLLGWEQTNVMTAVALGKGVSSLVPRSLVRPLVLLLAFAVAAAGGLALGANAAIVLFGAASVLSVLVQYALVRPTFRQVTAAAPDTSRWREWVFAGICLIPSRILSENLRNVFIIAASLALADADVARVTVGLGLVAFLFFALAAVENQFNPKISAAIARGEAARRDRLLLVSGLLKLLPVASASVILLAFMEPVLSVFGPAYASAAPMMAWLVLMPLVRALAGPAVMVLQVSSHGPTVMGVSLAGLIAIVLAVPLGSGAGLEAAAAAGTLAYAGLQAGLWLAAVRRTGIDPSPLSSLGRAMIRRAARG